MGQVTEGNRRFALQVRFEEIQRSSVDAIRNLKVGDADGHFIPIAQLADVIEEEGPAQISRENGQRRVSVELNVRGRDLGGFVAEAREQVERRVKLPEGYSVEWGGQFEQLESASRRLFIAVPLALMTIFVLLYLNFNAMTPAGLIFLNVPLAATGGILALLFRGLPFSISAGVGFIALFGVAVLNGVVLLTYISQLRQQGLSVEEAVREGANTQAQARTHDGARRQLRIYPYGVVHGSRSRGAASSRHRGDWWAHYLDSLDLAGFALPVLLAAAGTEPVVTEAEARGRRVFLGTLRHAYVTLLLMNEKSGSTTTKKAGTL